MITKSKAAQILGSLILVILDLNPRNVSLVKIRFCISASGRDFE